MTDELKDIKTIFRIIQSVPSKKLNPSTAIDRTRENYKSSLVPKNGYNSV